MKTTSIYSQLRKKASEFIEQSKTDLLIDKKSIDQNPNIDFIHITRKYGTSLVLFYKHTTYPKNGIFVPYLFGTANNIMILEGQRTTLTYYLKEDPLIIQYCKNGALTTINKEQALKIFANYKTEILNSVTFKD
jgi:hypothetical protein